MFAAVLLVGIVTLLLYWRFRPNDSRIHPDLDLEHWPVVSNESHNAFTDMVYWQSAFYLAHVESPHHLRSTDSRIVVLRSFDARGWEELAGIRLPGEDIRDPKLAVLGDEIFLYVLKNVDFSGEPYTTAVTTSKDGIHWSPPEDLDTDGWLYWRPKTHDGRTWYVPAYWWEHGRSILLKSTDGRHWGEVSKIYSGHRNDETAIEFLSDGRMIATARLEVSDSLLGHPEARTMVGVAAPPYKEWEHTHSYSTRLDGPALFAYQGDVYAIGRRHSQNPRWPTYYGGLLGTKRTSLYQVVPGGLVFLSDLPSSGDTSYAGCVLRGDTLYISYYTSDITRDWPWIMGMVKRSEIRMARVDMKSLRAIAASRSQ